MVFKFLAGCGNDNGTGSRTFFMSMFSTHGTHNLTKQVSCYCIHCIFCLLASDFSEEDIVLYISTYN